MLFTFSFYTIRILIFILLFTFAMSVQAGGVALGATRVIYPADSKQISLAVTNSDDNNRYLIQSWIENEQGEKTTDFVITPPLFVSKSKSENTLRIMYVGKELASDRESLFWLNSKAIPSVKRENIEGKNVLQIAILSRIKLFVRPAGLPTRSADAPDKLTFMRDGNSLKIKNLSPYYITMVNINIGTEKIKNTMIAPDSEIKIPMPKELKSNVLSYQVINDYGANTPKRIIQIQ